MDGVELLTGDETRRRFPWVPDDVLQARFRHHDGLIEPKRIAMGLLEGSGASVVSGGTGAAFIAMVSLSRV